jgi:diguanylate cyclase (GGDEF)-like protein/PAS domain S-box-containing protein
MKQFRENATLWYDALLHVIEATPDAIFFKDHCGRWIFTNQAAKNLFQLDDHSWQGKTDEELGVDYPQMLALHAQCFNNHDHDNSHVSKLLVLAQPSLESESRLLEYEVHKTLTFDKCGDLTGMAVVGRNITEKKAAERNLRVADAAIESQEAIVISDANNRIMYINSSYTRLTGYSKEDVIGKTSDIVKSGRHDQAFYQEMWRELRQNKFWQGEIWDRRKNGEIYPKWLTINAVAGPDGVIHNYVGSFTDLSEHKEAKEAIYRLAFYDPLTALPNRRLLNDRMQLAITNSNRSLHYGAVMMIDLDHFKFINDTMGHAVGDLLLIELAQCLKTCIREGDTVARLGGDEFVIMLEILSKDATQAALHAEMLAQKILKAASEPFLINGKELHCTLSIGVSMFSMPAISCEEMLKRADVAMYQAKSAGRNGISFYDPCLHHALEARLALLSELHHALPDDQLQLYYQAQVDSAYNIIGAEVLLRWQHPQRGLVSPDEFIALAEESGLIVPIGMWVLMTACMQLKLWELTPATAHMAIAVNVSAKQFGQTDFVEQVCAILDETGAKASLLKIELTESLMLVDTVKTIEKMQSLKLLGIRFSIDDFGTGYSSLSYLKKLPISQLKIDRSFVYEIDINQSDAIIAKTIIGMADSFGFNVIAEGVETEAQRACLESHGCFTYQGYLFSKPLPLSEFEQLMSTKIVKITNF